MTDLKTDNDTLEAFYMDIRSQGLAALWTRFRDLITPEPSSGCVAHHWRYADAREALLRAGELISAEDAERRVLIMENPGQSGSSQITSSLYAGLQLVLPGEVAPAHRHSQSALRLILEGPGSLSVVEGEPVTMAVGDLVVTPPWAWHDHRNDTDAPTIWLDLLDIPIVKFFDTSFIERGSAVEQLVTKERGHSRVQFGSALLPEGYVANRNSATPLTSYSFTTALSALRSSESTVEADPWLGHRVLYSDPTSGSDVLTTIAAGIQLLPAGFAGRAIRSTDATVYVTLQGLATFFVEDVRFDLRPGDVLVVPSWSWVRRSATNRDAIVFSGSDAAVQKRIGVWREERSDG
ncbi:gentisate 1,2-dioxygenase [Plantibacter flavus]|uniref:Gentisate 1,2-dioxygenase n=1 Tax=Plantibacter flavus TaxID=150123 RepID=A0A3N2C7J2_9MICO|nr:cupin domain-containing protein [Plantibacter flavus]ROR83489.1 gentisate 1,2-dioxygenase [Plantibacter flavus]SMG24059.1 gentisate 1,2-dioxygenase [Plantibacter flavus]